MEEPRLSFDLLNCTPHSIMIVTEVGEISIPPSGRVARLPIQRRDLDPIRVESLDVPMTLSTAGHVVVDLPEARPGCLILVSRMVAETLCDRSDLVFPDELIRDEQGSVIGCRRLARVGPTSRP